MSQHHSGQRRHCLRRLGAPLLAMAGLSGGGCAVSRIPGAAASRDDRQAGAPGGPASTDPVQALADARVSIVGEVHDNRFQHALRIGWLRQLVARNRFALVMEHFDVGQQPAIDQARRQGLDARALAQAAGFNFDGWDWAFYQPCVELALTHGLPLYAANLPGRAAMSAVPVDAPGWTSTDQQRLLEQIGASHCGALPARALAPMAGAQKARDRMMAQVVAQAWRQTGLPVVLLAGNGHARRDLGVPRYLPEWLPQVDVLAIGLLEDTDGDGQRVAGRYDMVVSTAGQPRADPCVAFLEGMKAGRGPGAR